MMKPSLRCIGIVCGFLAYIQLSYPYLLNFTEG